MSDVDLSQLIGGKSCTIYCTLSRNGCGVNTTALTDTRANAFTLLNAKCAPKLSEFLNTPFKKLKTPIPVKGYNGQLGTLITSILQAHLRIDGRRQYNVPFLITDLRNHDIILKRKWLAYLDLWLDVWNRQLIQPTSMLLILSFVQEINIAMPDLLKATPNPKHQADANCRNQLIEQEIQIL